MSESLNLITLEDFKQWMDENRPYTLIDVLGKDRYNEKHLPGARQASVFEMTFLDQIKDIIDHTAETTVIYGVNNNTMDSRVAFDKLRRAGYTSIYVLDGGMTAWEIAGYPVEGEKAGQPDESPTPVMISDGAYTVDVEKSTVDWAGRNPNSTHHGSIELSSGEITAASDTISGRFEINMTSIKNKNLAGDPLQAVLESHLKSDDFFFVDRFPKAVFTLSEATCDSEAISAPNYQVSGSFELCGIHKNISFPATASVNPDGSIQIEAHFDIDRTNWGIIYGSSRFFEFLGMHMVFDLVSIQLRIIATK